METENFENRKFHEKVTLVTSETIKFYDFSSLTRISLLAALALHIIMWLEERFCRRVIPSPGWLGEFVAKIVFVFSGCSTSNFSKSVNSFGPTVFFPMVFSHVAFDWRCHIAKQKRNGRAWHEQALVPWNPKISKIENFMKSWSWWAVRRLKCTNFLAGAISMPCGAHVFVLHDS